MNKAVIHFNTFDFGWESRIFLNPLKQETLVIFFLVTNGRLDSLFCLVLYLCVFHRLLPLASLFMVAKRFSGKSPKWTLKPILHNSRSITCSIFKILYKYTLGQQVAYCQLIAYIYLAVISTLLIG